MSEPITPALTPEEWEKHQYTCIAESGSVEIRDGYLRVFTDAELADWTDPNDRHALAALCLHGQPFGFTREDVELLHSARKCLEDYEHPMGGNDQSWPEISALADRIAALLPPET